MVVPTCVGLKFKLPARSAAPKAGNENTEAKPEVKDKDKDRSLMDPTTCDPLRDRKLPPHHAVSARPSPALSRRVHRAIRGPQDAGEGGKGRD